MTGFTDLHIRTDGFGPYHINRFRIAFRSDFGIPYLANLLVHSFPGYFNGPGGHCYRLEGDKLKFFGNLSFFSHDVPTPHPDWVRVIYTDPLHGFTVQTLHRDSIALDDLTAGASFTALGAGAGAAVGTPIAGVGALPGALIGGATGLVSGVSLNRRHFLAGRRAWAIDVASSFTEPGDGENFPKDALIIETAAIERYSAAQFWALQKTMTPVVTELWSHMLMKFATATRAGYCRGQSGRWSGAAGSGMDSSTTSGSSSGPSRRAVRAPCAARWSSTSCSGFTLASTRTRAAAERRATELPIAPQGMGSRLVDRLSVAC